MNTRIAVILVVALAGVLALSGSVLAHPGPAQDGPAQDAKDSPGPYAVRMQAAAGGAYHLDGGGWQVRGAAGGPGYRLEVVASPAGTGTPCCCTYLPCILRNNP